MKYVYLVLAVFTACTSAMSQRYAQPHKPEYKGGIRFNFLGLIDPFDNNISVGGEYYFHTRWSVTADVAYIFLSEYLSQSKSSNGLMFKPGIRYYTSDYRTAFLEAVALYKGVGYRFEDWLGKDCVDGVPTYDEYQKFTFAKRVLGLNFQGGGAANLNKDNSLRLEFFGGLGIRFKWQHVKNEPNACYQRNQLFRNRLNNDYYVTTSLPVGIRMVYRLE